MHGIEREMRRTDSDAQGSGVSKIIVRYADGRILNFVPDVQREVFHEDDVLELKKVVSSAAATAEWSNINTRMGF